MKTRLFFMLLIALLLIVFLIPVHAIDQKGDRNQVHPRHRAPKSDHTGTLDKSALQFSIPQGQPASLNEDIPSLFSVATRNMPPQNNQALLDEARQFDEGGPYIFAEPIPVRITPRTDGTWETLPNGSRLWRMHIKSDNAISVNLGFTNVYLPPKSQLFIFSPDFMTVIGPFKEDDNEAHRQLWTPIIPGEEVFIELMVHPDMENEVVLELTSVNHAFRDLGESAMRSGACNVDVVCPEGDLIVEPSFR